MNNSESMRERESMRYIEEERERDLHKDIHPPYSRQKEIGRVEWDDEQTTTTLLKVGISISLHHHHHQLITV